MPDTLLENETDLIEALKRSARQGDRRALQELRDRGFFNKSASPPPARRNYPMSHAQRRMWILDQIPGASSAYVLARALSIGGALDTEALTRAFAAMIRRHEALRTTFERIDDEPQQVVHATMPFAIETHDARDSAPPAARARDIAAEAIARPFDLTTGPLLRVALIRTGEARHVLVVALHHIVCDAWSLDVIARELGTLYAAERTGTPATLTPLPVQYKDFAAWQNERLQSPDAARHLAYWRRKLAEPLPVLDLPFDRPRPKSPDWRGHTITADFGPTLREGLVRLGMVHRATLATTTLALVKTLLMRVTGQREIIVGVPVAGRDHADLEHEVGMYANAVALRSHAAPDLPFAAFLDAVKYDWEEAADHQETPFDELVAALGLDRDPTRSPVFDVLAGFVAGDRERLVLDGLELGAFDAGSELAPHDLTLYFADDGRSLALAVTYRGDLWDHASIRRLIEQWRHLAASAVANPETPLAALDLGEETPHAILPAEHEAIAARLIDRAGLANAVVVPIVAANGTPELTAFCVPADTRPIERVLETVRSAAADIGHEIAAVPVSAIPFLPSGRLHLRALERAAGEIAAALEPATPLLHLWDLVPHDPASSSSAAARQDPAASTTTAHDLDETPALADGGPAIAEPGAPATLPGIFIRAAETTHDARIVFVADDGSEVRLSYADLLDRASRVLGGLRERGHQPGGRAILLLRQNIDILTGFWACVLGGITPVIAAIPPDFSRQHRTIDHLAHFWRQLEEPLFLTETALAEPLLSLRRVFDIDTDHVAAIEDLDKAPPATAFHEAQPGDTAFFTLTSGSTGTPKCVMLSHAAILARARGTNLLCKHSQSDVILNWLPFDHIGSLSDWHVRCVELACTLVYANKEAALGDPLNWLRLLDRYRATHSWAPNFAYALVNDTLRGAGTAGLEALDLSCVKGLLTAGENVARPPLRAFLDRLAPLGMPDTAIAAAFGMAEMGSGVTYALGTAEVPLRFHQLDRASLDGRLREVDDETGAAVIADLGPPIPGIQLRIVDETGRPLPERRIGRLQVGGLPLADGYYRDPDATAAAFDAEGWFTTGDLGFLAEGRLSLTGRASESIIISGANYSCAEIETAVESVPGIEVSFTAAAAVRHTRDADEKLAIFFAPADRRDDRLTALLPEIRDAVAGRVGILPDYLVPVRKEDVPKTAIGKIQRARLVRAFTDGECDDAVRRTDLLGAGGRTIPDWFARKLWQRCDARPLAPLAGTASIMPDSDGVAPALAARLEARGVTTRLLREGDEPASDIVIDLRGLDADTTEIGSCLALAQQLARRPEHSTTLLVATRGALIVDPNDTIAGDRPAWPGLIASLRQELPTLTARLVDLVPADPQTLAEQCLAELARRGGEALAAWRGGTRYEPRLTRGHLADEPAAASPFVEGGLYLVAGGTGGIGRHIATRLLNMHGARLLLVGRSPEIAPETLTALGHPDRILYRPADITDLAALHRATDEAERHFGTRLAGIVHLAGIAADRPILDETPANIAATLRPKMAGTRALAELAAQRCKPGDPFVAFSSVNGWLGGAGAAGYSAANAYLDASCDELRARGLRCWTLAWSMWDETGLSRGFALKDAVRAKGFHILRPDAALASFEAAIRRRPGYLMIGVDPRNQGLRHHFAEPPQLLRDYRDDAAAAGPIAPRNATERALAAIWRDLLDLSEIGVHDHFIRLGGHSLKATQMVARVQRDMGAAITLQDVFRAPTIAGLAELIGGAGISEIAPIERVPDAPDYPVSHAQRRLWIIERLGINQAAYNIPSASLIDGDIDTAALRQAVGDLLRRHESLRTVFAEIDGTPRQIVLDRLDVPIEIVDLRSSDDPEAAAREAADRDAARAFDIAHGPLLRVSLLRLGERRWVLLLNVHHIVSDGWSIDVMVRDLLAFYAAARDEAAAALPELPLQYRDFAAWQQTLLAGPAAATQRDYWLTQLGGELPLLEMPADRRRPAVRSFRGGLVEFAINPATTGELQRLATARGITMFTVWLTLLRVLLYRYAGATDAVIGSPVAGREHPDLAPQVGFFVNMLPLRLAATGEQSFDDVLAQAQAVVEGALANQAYPYDLLVEELAPRRDMGRNPLFDAVLSVMQPEPRPAAPGIAVTPFPFEARSSKFDLTLFLGEEAEGGWSAAFEYDSDLFDRPRIENLAAIFNELAAAAVRDPSGKLRDFDILPPAQRRLVLDTFATAPARYPRDQGIAAIFEEEARRFPDTVAAESTNSRLTYRELNQLANGLALTLRNREAITSEEPVGVLLGDTEWITVAFVGILKAGAAYLPLDTAYPADRIAYLLKDTGCRVILADAGTIREHAPHHPGIRFIDLHRTAEPAEANPPAAATGNGLAYIMYTSGTSGRPKGVLIEQRAVLRLVLNTNFVELGSETRILMTGAVAFDASTFEIWGALLNGGTLVRPPAMARLEPTELKALIRTHRITTMWLTASLFNQIVDADPDVFTGLKHLLIGGERLSGQHVGIVQRAHPRLALINGYGPTENTTFTATHRISPSDGDDIPIGRPVANTTVYVLDRDMRTVPLGVPGEICTGGDGLARGYLNDDALTAERFVPHPYRPGERLYRTGDLGYWRPDGSLQILGRLDDQVKIRGFRVEPGEIETRLRDHPQVQDAAVIAKPTGAGTYELIAYVAAEPALSIPGLQAALGQTLPDYMVPARFVRLDRLPLNTVGKVDRSALPAPDDVSEPVTDNFAAPRNPAETLLAGLWADVLGRARIGIHDNFFEIGGDSIRAIQIAGRARAAGWSLLVRDIFEQPTVASLAPRLTPLAGAAAEAQPFAGTIPQTATQRWFFDTYRGPLHHFNQALLLRPRRKLNPQLLAAVLQRLQDRHDALRLVVTGQTAEIRADLPLQFETLDLTGAPDATAALSAALDARHDKFDLAHAPLWRAALIRLADGERLWLAAHHLIVDGVSWRVLLEDIEIGYDQAERGTPIELGPPTAGFARWAEEQAQFAASDEVRAELDYWRGITSPAAPPAQDLYGSVQTIECELSPEDTGELIGAAHHAYGTQIDDLLLVALGRALAQPGGGDSVLVTLEGHGRERLLHDVDLTRSAGWFTSLYPFALDASHGYLRMQIRQVKERLRQVPRKGAGYGVLRYLTDALPGTAAPHPRISFNYLGQLDGPSSTALFDAAPEPAGAAISPKLTWPHEIDVLCAVSGGRMRLTVAFTPAAAPQAPRLLAGFADELRQVVAHCRGRATEPTPADFAAPDLTLAEFDALLARRGWQSSVIENLLPPTPMQEGLLVESLADRGTRAYFVQMAFTLAGALDPDQFEAAWHAVARRHWMLRAGILHEGLPRPLLAVFRERKPAFRHLDLRSLDAAAQRAAIEAECRRDREHGFDFEREPLWRFTLFRLGDTRWRVVWSYHHVLLDGWSLGIVLRDFGEAYGALTDGRQPELPPAPPAANLTRWQQSRDHDAALAWWRDHLSGYEAAAIVPGRLPPQTTPSQDVAEIVFELDEATTAGLRANAAAAGATLSTLIQAAWAVVLGRYNGTDDAVFGTVVSGRAPDLEGAEDIVAAMINAVPARARPRPGDTIEALIRGLQQDLLAAEPSQHLPLAEIQAESPLGRNLLSHVVVVENYPLDAQVAAAPLGGELAVEEIEAHDRTHYDFALVLVPGERLRVVLEYNVAARSRVQMERTAEHYRAALIAFAGAVERRLGDIDIIPAAERAFLASIARGPSTTTVAPTIVDMVEAQIAASPDNPAIEDRGQCLTYGALGDRIASIADLLHTSGVAHGDFVAILQDRSAALPPLLLAVMQLGAAYVPIDPGYPDARIRLMFEDSECRFVIAGAGSATRLPDWHEIRQLDGLFVFARTSDHEKRAADAEPQRPAPDDAAYVLYTSGSTGRPKGVVIPHRAVASQVSWVAQAFGIGPADRFLHKTALGFDPSLTEIFAPLSTGGCVVVADADAHIDPDYLRTAIVEQRITLIDLVPSQLAMINARGGLPNDTGLRHVFVGGEALDPALLSQLSPAPSYRLHNLYGPSETCVNATVWTWDGRRQGPVPIGRPVGNTAIHIVDHDLHPVPLGVPGEICIAGTHLANGYLNRLDLTAAAFVTAVGGDRLYRTGDLGRWMEDGQLEFLGRIDAQVKIRGHRIECGEVEAALRAVAGVKDAVALGCPAPGGDELVAFVVGEFATPTDAALRTALAANLPDAMLPSRYIALDAIPLLANGKIDLRGLRVTADISLSTAAPATAPTDPREAAIAAIWQEVLGRQAIGSGDNFFEIGGHSLKAIQILARLQQELGLRLSVREFFANPTITAQANLLKSGLTAADDRIEPATPQATYALSHAQSRLWLLHQIPGGETAYNMPFAFTIAEHELDRAALEHAFAALCERHEILRTAFVVIDGEPRQQILPPAPPPLRHIDLRDWAPAAAETEARDLVDTEIRVPFDLLAPPLLRILLIAMPGAQPRAILVLTMHHIVGDGWSGVVLEREVRALYDAFRQGLPDPLPPLAIQYKDYSEWQARRRSAEAEAWWLHQMAEMPDHLALNYDTPPAGERDFAGAVEEATLSREVTAGLRRLAQARGITVAHALLALFQLALYRITGQDDICVGMSVANRGQPELERLIGFFVNILPIRTRFTEAMELDDVLTQVAHTASEALDRQDYPFDLLVRRLAPARVTDRQPLVSVVYAFQNFEDVNIDIGAADTVAKNGGDVGSFDFSFGTSKFDLTLFVVDQGDALRLTLEYDSRLFRQATARHNLGVVVRFATAASQAAAS